MPRAWWLLACLSVAACSRRSEAPQRTEPSAKADEEVYRFRSGDLQMLAAQEQARQTLTELDAALAHPPPDARDFQVKVGFSIGTGPEREHLWLSDVALTDSRVSGKVVSHPAAVPLSFGKYTSAPRADITDWMYVDGGVVHGGFTWRVILSRMSPEDREKKLKEMGVRLE
jgi:uncharacterized protein YegJ (DUF2314 family)